MCGARRSGLVVERPLAVGDAVDLAADGDHRVAEAVELGERLALGRLDHQRAGDGEAHRRGVEAVVHQPLGDVVDGDAGRLGDRPQVDDALVADAALGARVEDGEVLVRAGWPRSWPSRSPRPSPASTRRGPSGRCTPRGSAGSRPIRTAPPTPGRPAGRRRRAGRRAGTGRGAAHGDRADAGAAAAVGDAERLVQVEVADVGAEAARAGDADEGVEVGAVDVHLAAGVVHERRRSRRSTPRTRRASTGRSP